MKSSRLFSRSPEAGDFEATVADILAYSRYYCAMALGAETDPDLKLVFHDIRELKVDVAFPFLLELYHDYVQKVLSKEDFLQAARLVEAYVFRRAVCAIPTNSMNMTFGRFARNLKKDRYLESIQAHFTLLPSYKRFPDDREFSKDLQARDLYNFQRGSYWLRRLENYGRKERVPVNEYTIEHILPQNENLSSQWKATLGPEWERIQKTYLHTLGNLTLTGYNSEYSDRSFTEKRDMPGGFAQSPLLMNQGLAGLKTWDEDAIKRRAEELASRALKVWPAPSLDQAVIETYKVKAEPSGTYSIADHPHLAGGPVRELFEALRKEVLALDPGVTEEFMKSYVTYRAESGFAFITPQAKRLRMTLKHSISEIQDPRGICKENPGQRRNSEILVSLSSVQDLPYVMGLIRQALEKQMGSDGDA